jgi:hypothetical protein
MIKRLLSMLLSLTVILSLVPPITAAAADDGIMMVGTGATAAAPYELPEEAFLWESSTNRTTLAGINPEWYETNVTDAGVKCISIKIPASTETIRKDFGGSYATIKGYSTAGTELIPAKLDCQQVLVDFSAATNLKTIERQAFFEVSGLTGVIDLSKTKVEVIEGTAFKKTAITGVILPTTLKRVGNDNANSSGDASVFGQCKNLAYIRVTGGDPNAVLELPSSLQLIGYTGFLLDDTKIEQTMKTNPFVIKIPASVTEMQHTAIGFDDLGAVRKAQYCFDETDFSGTNFQNDCLFNSSYTNNWGVARFASKEAYDSFIGKYSGSSNFYGYPTYEFTLEFKDTSIAQTKLWGQSIQYEKGSDNYWKLNTGYALPDAPTGQEPAAGQVGYWELNGDKLKADSKLPATPAATPLTAVWKVETKLAEPTIAYTLNGKVQGYMTDSKWKVLEVPYVNGQPGTIGVQVDHPLLKENHGTDDNYVYFKYRWLDVNSMQLGSRSQNIEDGSGFYNRTTRTAPDVKYNEIPIRNSGDNRVGTGGYPTGYTFYICDIYGYHVQNGAEKLFYAANYFSDSFAGRMEPEYVDPEGRQDYLYISAKFLDVWTITFDLNGGTAPEGVDYSPVQVKKGKAYPTPTEPLKPGYTCWGWKEKDGTKEYYLGMAIEKDQDVTLVAQYDPNNYTIKYEPNLTGATGTVGPQTYEYDTADFKLTTDTFTSTTKDFLGWSLTADATEATYASGAAIDNALKAAMTASPDETVTLYAVWKDKTTHTVTFNAGTNGSFTNASDPLIGQTVVGGLSVTGVPAVTASGRYRFDGWKLDGDSSGKVYTNDEVKAMVINGNMTFTASYTYVGGSSGGGSGSVSSYIIKATAGANGSISPNGTISVSRGANKTFSIKANAGYEIADVRVDGTSVGAVRTYEFKNVTKAHEIYATFKKTENEPEQEVADPEKTGVAGLLETVKHNAYLHGYGNGGFGPNNNMTRAEAAQMFYNLLREKNVTVTVRFTDVPDDAWYATAVNTLASLGILKGVGEDKYDPTRAISRAEFAAIATRFAKVNLEGSTPFDDVSDTDWYYNAVLTAVNYGWINGYGDNTFRPYNTVTRAEVTTIVNRMLARRADKDFVADHIHNMRTFNDVDSSFWAYHYIMEATNGHDYDKNEHKEIWKSHTAQ